MTDHIQYTTEDYLALITLNRPGKSNALDTHMVENLKQALTSAADDDSIRAVLLRANGNNFCAGQDLTEFDRIKAEGISVGDHLREGYNALIAQMQDLQKPIVCGVNGVAAGAGAALTLGCDIRLAASDATFIFGAFVGIGLVPDTATTYLLPRMIGNARALALMLLNDGENRLSAEQAEEWGLVNEVTPPDDLSRASRALAERLAALPPVAVRLTKQLVGDNLHRTLPEALEAEAAAQDTAAGTEDHEEGVRAFLEKRKPRFSGN